MIAWKLEKSMIKRKWLFLSKTEEKPVGLKSKLWIPRDEKHGSSIEVLSAEWCKEIFTHTKKCMKKTLRRAVKSEKIRGEDAT